MATRLLIIFLAVMCVVMGVHYSKYRFGIGPGLPDLGARWGGSLKKTAPDASVASAVPAVPATPSAAAPSARAQLYGLLAVPLILDESGVASSSVSLAYIKVKRPAMVVLFGSDVAASTAAALTAQLHALPTPPVVAVDHEGGVVQRLGGAGFVRLPSWRELCGLPDTQRQSLIASAAAQLHQAGIDVVLGPVVDRAASGSALRSRACAADPDEIVARSEELIAQYQAAGIATVLKHYPGIGGARADLHAQSVKVSLTPQDTQPFEQLLAAHPQSPVMVSHLRLDAADPDTPCSLSYLCVSELRRVFPRSLVMADALDEKSAGYLATSSALLRPLPVRTVVSLRAGVDLALFGPTVSERELEQVVDQLEKDMVLSGKVTPTATAHLERIRQWREHLPAVH